MIMVVLPSGILKLLTICARVPVGKTSAAPGSSLSPSRCAIIPTYLGSSVMLRIRRRLLSRPAVIGATTPGKMTVFLNGRMASSSGKSVELISTSSSEVINGINSVLSLIISLSDKLSIIQCNIFPTALKMQSRCHLKVKKRPLSRGPFIWFKGCAEIYCSKNPRLIPSFNVKHPSMVFLTPVFASRYSAV